MADTTTSVKSKRLLSESSVGESSKVRKLSESDESSSSTAVSATNIPKWTSSWTTADLDLLRIFVEREKCPAASLLFKMWLKTVILNRKIALGDIETRARKIIKHMESFNTLLTLDFDTIYDMNSRPFFNMNQDGFTLWTCHTPPLDNEKHWSHMFTTFQDKFAWDIRYMCAMHQQGRRLKESMYVSLFQDFLGLLGVITNAAVDTKELKIGNTEMYSEPDMLIMDRQTDGADMKILAVIEAKRTYAQVENFSPHETRSRSTSQLHTKSELKISDKMIGKHGGDQLLHCPMSSSYEGGMLGMIVQNTHVAFTYLSCNKEQFETIVHGNGVQDSNPTITVSKSYNFLKASDRKELVEPLVTLGLLQIMP